MNSSWNRRDVLTAGALSALLPLGLPFGLSLASCDSRTAGPTVPGKFTFIDGTGLPISLQGPARRIVALMTPDAATVIAVHGSPARLAGIHPRARPMFQRGFIARLFPEVMNIPANIVVGSGFSPNVEAIARLSPDVVVVLSDRGAGLTEPLEKLGLTVARYKVLPGGVDETLGALFTMLGTMIGDTSRSEFLIRLRADVRQRLAGELRSIPPEQRPRSMIVMPAGEGLMVSGGGEGSIYADFLYKAGSFNAASSLPDTLSPVGNERIAAWNPQVVFVVYSAGATPSRIYDDPILGSTDAARNRRVYVLPIGSHHWGSQGPEDPLVQRWMAELLHPDLFDRSLRATMRRAYQVMFNHTFTDDELDDVLLRSINAVSKDYARFDRDGLLSPIDIDRPSVVNPSMSPGDLRQ